MYSVVDATCLISHYWADNYNVWHSSYCPLKENSLNQAPDEALLILRYRIMHCPNVETLSLQLVIAWYRYRFEHKCTRYLFVPLSLRVNWKRYRFLKLSLLEYWKSYRFY